MDIVILFSLFCVVFANDGVHLETAPDGCDDVSPALTATKTGRTAWDKCIEYQARLVYPCDRNTSLTGQQNRVNYCQVENKKQGGGPPIPHMVLLGFFDNSPKEWKWTYGAALLSEKFILGAAHSEVCWGCGKIPITHAKIGNIEDITKDGVYKIKSIIPHPEFKLELRYNDIALFELDKPVTLTHDIVPACLPVEDDIKYDTALGGFWERTAINNQTDNRLQKWYLKKLTHEECSERFPSWKTKNGGVNSTTQMCYEDRHDSDCLVRFNDDSSNSVLQVLNTKIDCMYTVLGVGSFDQTSNGTVPAMCWQNKHSMGSTVYTKVAPYVSWIESVVWP